MMHFRAAALVGREMDGTDDTVDEAADEEEEDVKVSSRKTSGLWKLYISRALTAWGDRLWAFGLGLFLLRVISLFLHETKSGCVIFRFGLKTF